MSFKRNIPLYFVFTFLVYFYVWMPIWVIYFQEKGMELHQLGLMDAVGFLIMAFAEVPTGAVADKYGKKYSLAIGALVLGLGMLGITADLFSIWFIIGYIFWNIANPFFSGANTALLYDSLVLLKRNDEYQKIVGRNTAVMQVSQIGGGILGGFIASYSLELSFIIAGVLSLAAIIVALLMKEPVLESSDEDRRNEKYLSIIKNAFFITVKKPSLMYLMIYSSLLSTFLFVLTYVIYQPYAIGVGYTLSSLGILVFFIKGASIIGNMSTVSFAKIVNPKNQVFLLPLVISLGMILMGAVTSKLSMFFLVLMSLVGGLIFPTISKMLNDEIPSSHRATILSFQGLLWTAFGAILEPFVLFLADFTNIGLAVFISGFSLLFLSMLVSMLWLRSKSVRATVTSAETKY